MNNIKILFFATLREHIGVRSVDMQIPTQMNVSGFKALLIERFPILEGRTGHMLVSVNQEYALDDAVIPDAAEIALFPPVSGG